MVTNTHVGKGNPPDPLITDETPDAACTVHKDTQHDHQRYDGPNIDRDIGNHDKHTDATGMTGIDAAYANTKSNPDTLMTDAATNIPQDAI